MTSTSRPIVFFGTEEFSARFLETLIDGGYSIEAVVTKPDMKKGRGQKLTEPLVKTMATRHGITVWQPHKLRDLHDDITKLGPVAGVLVSYGKIIPASIIELFDPGIINVHPSLLPRYRGPSPVEAAIMNGDTETGVSIMRLSKDMDAGPVYRQAALPLTGQETRLTLYETLGDLGIKTLLDNLPGILEGSLTPQPQDDSSASYCALLSKDDSLIDPQAVAAEEAQRHVRAYLGFPKSKVTVNDMTVIVTKAHVSDSKNTTLDIPCRGGSVLAIDSLVAPSGKSMDAADFLRGYRL